MYTLRKQIGSGANGVVWLADSITGHRLAVKYWLPWICRLYEPKRLNATKVEALKTWAKSTDVVVSVNDVRIKLSTYGPSASFAHKALSDLGIDARFEREQRSPSCATFCIAACVDPMPISNGVVVMDLVGPSLAGQCPLDSSREQHCAYDTLVTAAMSALTQNRCIPDFKPGNLCRDGYSFKVVDVDMLPKITDTNASQWASYTIPCLNKNLVATMMANLVLTIGQIYGTIQEWTATYTFHHNSKVPRDIATLRQYAPECCKAIAAVIDPDLTREMALDTLGCRLALSP